MPVVLVFMGVAALVTGISALVVHNSISKSTSSSNILSEIGETKENLDKEIKTKLFLGTVTIIAYIAEREQMKKKQHEEMLQSIGGGVAAATELSTAATIKVAQDAIAELQTEQGQEVGSTTSETTAVNIQEKEYVETFPATQEQGSQIYDTPAGQIEGPLINIFPWVQPEPKVYDTPKDNIDIPSINIFPEAKAKELGDSILWAKVIPKTGTWTPVGKTLAEWISENGYIQGPDHYKNKDSQNRKSYDVKDSSGKVIGRLDKGYRVNGKVVVDHVHLNTDVGNVHHYFN